MTEIGIDRWDLIHLLLSIDDRPRGARDGRDLTGVVTRAVDSLSSASPLPRIDVPAAWTAPLRVEGHPTWIMETNSWLLIGGGECVVVDVPPEPRALIDRMDELGVVPTAIVLTHGHLDHVGGVADLLAAFGTPIPVHVHPGDAGAVARPESGGALVAALRGLVGAPASSLVGHASLTLAGVTISPLRAPGHTIGSTCLLVEGTARPLLLSGDILFAGGVGRCDLTTGRPALAEQSLRHLLNDLDDDVVVLPGHGGLTTVGTERAAVAPADARPVLSVHPA